MKNKTIIYYSITAFTLIVIAIILLGKKTNSTLESSSISTFSESNSIKGSDLNLNNLAKEFYKDKSDSLNAGFDLNSTNLVDPRKTIPPALTYENVQRSDLNKLRTIVKLYDGKEYAGITIPGFGVKLNTNESNLNVFYLESAIVKKDGKDVIVGVGYSIHYLFKKVKKGLNINNLGNIAASVQLDRDKTEVYYVMQTYGLSGTELSRYFKPIVNKNFDVEGYGVMQSAIDGIHNVLTSETQSPKLIIKPELIDDNLISK